MSSHHHPLQEDDEYFMDEVITFQVKNTLLRVPSSRFIDNSPTFASTFGLLQTDGSPSKETIMMPEEVSIYDFKLLLRVLYPPATPAAALNSFGTGQLVQLAGLFKKWGFRDLLKATFKEIETEPHISVMTESPPANLVHLGRELSYPAWICSGFMFLVGRKKPLTEEEAGIIGEKSAAVVRKLRRKHLGRKPVKVDAEIVIEAFPEELSPDAVRSLYDQSCRPSRS